jgi:hypothetical protein
MRAEMRGPGRGQALPRPSGRAQTPSSLGEAHARHVGVARHRLSGTVLLLLLLLLLPLLLLLLPERRRGKQTTQTRLRREPCGSPVSGKRLPPPLRLTAPPPHKHDARVTSLSVCVSMVAHWRVGGWTASGLSALVMVCVGRIAEFQTGLKEAFRATRKESMSLADILSHLNSGRARPFSDDEAEAVLTGLEQQNRIMYRDRHVFLI